MPILYRVVLHLGLGDSSLDSPSFYHNVFSQIENETDYWDWETSTRFRRPDTAAKLNVKNDNICDTFPTHLLSRIQVVLKIGSSEPMDRLTTQTSTVTRCISNLIIVSDRRSELNGHHVYDILATLPGSYHESSEDFQAYDLMQRGKSIDAAQGWRLDRFKFLPMVEFSYEMNPTAEWFVFLESDTYFVWDNLFRLLDHFDPSVPLYFGSPSPGKEDRGKRTFFAYGGAGFVLSAAAIDKLVARKIGSHGEYIESPLSKRYEELLKADPCGDSVLGWALHERGVQLSGLWPMFNPHPLHGIPFDNAYWCQPVISMHKSLLADMEALVKWEHKRDREKPLLYADLFEYLKLGTMERQNDWDNGDWGGFQEPPESAAHKSVENCREACHKHTACRSYTYDHAGHCVFVPTMRLGTAKPATADVQLSAGWDLEKLKNWRATHPCEKPLWVKPSTTRIF
ncbi:glycosyltransferase family 31 protein [Aspergillus tanneri]|uniref:N-acetylgalactosaminide beta-1,3-galactosyltransferase n=1 Tax=Aspergillus tanneri TaxID=1220188 RepID=A0A5M9N0H3_9EURO|nr:uncharacterized protein ATNIH1004_003803 [Aspergillus tanneri]KAA8651110.1 hypothetical protein ATNIH1004_003803 [Aspergillus tanneri]